MGLYLERVRSYIFENDQAHYSLIALFVIWAIFEVFYLKRLGVVLSGCQSEAVFIYT